MAKRFSDTDKWKKEWFRKLPIKLKAAWEYLRDNCDQAGIWDGDFGLMSFQLGEPIGADECLAGLGPSRIVALDDGKFLLPGFIPFQYGNLNPENKAHASILKKVDAVTVRRLSPDSPRTHCRQSQDPPKGTYGDGNGRGDGNGDGNGNGEGGARGKVAEAMAADEVEGCLEEWRSTLKHFDISRTVGERDHLAIARAVQSFGPEWVRQAFQGARKQTKGPRFDPRQFVSLSIYLHKDRIERLVNIGAGKESADGVDWSQVFGKVP